MTSLTIKKLRLYKKLYRQENTNMNSESPQLSLHFSTEHLIESMIKLTVKKCSFHRFLLYFCVELIVFCRYYCL